jgi:hypothetical protein
MKKSEVGHFFEAVPLIAENGRKETKKISTCKLPTNSTTFGNMILSGLFRQFRQTVLFRLISFRFVFAK